VFADTWLLPPILPQQLMLGVPTTPPATLLDSRLPLGFGNGTGSAGSTGGAGGTSGTSGAGGTGGAGSRPASAADSNVDISMLELATARLPGTVLISVARQVVLSGEGFSFTLPPALDDPPVDDDDVRVTLTNGAPLPTWLRYSRATRSFKATAPPAGALPLDVQVRVGSRRWTVRITERMTH